MRWSDFWKYIMLGRESQYNNNWSQLKCSAFTSNATDIVVQDLPRNHCPVTVFGFGSPYVGDIEFKKTCDSMEDLHVLLMRNLPDQIPNYPLLVI